MERLVWTPERIARFWDYTSRFPEHYFTRRHARGLLRCFARHLRGGVSVADYGAGTGFLLEALLRAGVRSWGYDTSPESVERLRARFGSHPHFAGAEVIAAGEEAGSAREPVDTVFLVEVFEHLDDATGHEVLAGIARLLKPGGVLLLTTPHDEDLESSMILCPGCDHTFHRWQHQRSFDAPALRSELEAAGFAVESCEATDFRLWRRPGAPLRQRWSSFTRRLRGRAPRKLPHLYAVARRHA